MLKLGLSRVVVFEDDLRFSNGGLERIKEVLEDLDASKMEWDLIYLGRKKQANQVCRHMCSLHSLRQSEKISLLL